MGVRVKTKRGVLAVLCLAIVPGVLLFRGMQTLFAAPVPSVTFQNVESAPFVGEDFTFTLRFDNSGDAVGYGPYIDVVIPEYVSIQSMSYQGTSLSYQSTGVFPVGDPSCVTHPFARDVSGSLKQVCLSPNPGANVRLYSVKLPFGSFVDTQTVANIDVVASMDSAAPIGVDQTLHALGGFYLGEDPLDNPASDPAFDSGFVTTIVAPSVIRVTKEYVADYLNGSSEYEINPGPNNRQTFRITADIADGATITNLSFSDTIDSLFGELAFGTVTPAATTSSIVANVINASWNSVTGGAGPNDVVLNVEFEVPYRNNDGTILNVNTGATRSATNVVTANGTYNLSALPSSNAILSNSIFIKPLAIEKSVAMYTDTNASGYSPGDTVRYTLETTVGDYQAAENINVEDVLPDGMTFVGGSAVATITEGGASHVSAVSPSSSAGPGAGQTTLEWDFSPEGLLRGDCVPIGGSGVSDPTCSSTHGRTKIVITFEATINDTYIGGNRVEHRDNLNNTTSVSAGAIDPQTLASTGGTYTDTSSANLTIVSGSLTKTIYAVNGSTTLPDRLQPGDDVTYRLQYVVPSTDFQSVRIDDFLPLPMFNATQLTTFNAADPLGTIPAPGEANFGINETLYSYGLTSPVLSSESGNVVRFDWPSTHDPSNQSRRIDIMFTVTITDAAYAPGLYVTNQATVTENNIQTSFASNSIQQIELEIPELSI